jgi:hypothetical protein
MTGDTPSRQDFANWNGKPFFEGHPLEGRHVYILKTEEPRGFTAFGVMDDSRQLVFRVRGTEADLERFLNQMKAEDARVTYGTPPFDTKTGGDKSDSSTTKPGRK